MVPGLVRLEKTKLLPQSIASWRVCVRIHSDLSSANKI